MNRPLTLLLLAYLILAAGYAVRTPAWLAPDEPAHYNYIAQVAAGGCCPTIQPGDWDQAYLDMLRGNDFAPDSLDRLDTIQYEDHQPPLYYLLGSLIFRLSDGSLTALRLFSVIIGAGVVTTTFFTVRAMLPLRPDVALGTAGVVAFIPQHLHILASVNNDGLAELIVALTLWALIVYIKQDRQSPRVSAWMLGILVGVGLLTKVSTIFMAGVVPLFIVLRLWLDSRAALQSITTISDTQSPPDSVGTPLRGVRNASSNSVALLPSPRLRGRGVGGEGVDFQMLSEMFIKTTRYALPRLIPVLIAFAIPALLLAEVWWIRNFGVYGFPDFLGLRAHDAVVVGQPRTADLIASVGFGEYLRQLVQTTFNSFWGQFGWMEMTLPSWAYFIIGVLLLLSFLGWMLYAFTRLRPSSRLSTALHPPLSYGEGSGVRSIFPPPAPDPAAPPVSSSPALASPAPDPLAAGHPYSQPLAWALLLLTAILAIAQFAYYNTEFQQFQGRYTYPGLIPFALILTLGITTLTNPFIRRIPILTLTTPPIPFRSAILSYLTPVLLLLPLIAINLYALWRLLPSLAS